MSGKRQHFIPRFLLAGFASHGSGDDASIWVYRKDKPAFNTNTRNVGVEGAFYSDGDDSIADDLITDREWEYSELIARLRKAKAEKRIEAGEVSKLIAHFEIRTRHIRQSFIRAGGALLERLLCDETQPILVNQLMRGLVNDPTPIHDALLEKTREFGLPDTFADSLFEATKPSLPQTLPAMLKFLPLVLSQMRAGLPAAMVQGAKRGQITALKGGIAPEARVRRYEALAYSVAQLPSGNLPLGDSIVLFRTSGQQPFKPLLEARDDLASVFLPVSKDAVLVGTANGAFDVPPDLPEIIAGCSLEFFVSASRTGAEERRAKNIGQFASLLPDEAMSTLIESVLREAGEGRVRGGPER